MEGILRPTIKWYNIGKVSVNFRQNDDFWRSRTDVNDVKSVKMSSFDVKWRQSVWRVRILKMWRLCRFLSIYDVFWHFLTIAIFGKKFLTKFDDLWRIMTMASKPLTSFDDNWRQMTSIESTDAKNRQNIYFNNIMY